MPRILIIDDNPQDRRLARRALEQEFTDAKVVDVADEPAMTAALDTTAFDAVSTDYRLRWTDGLQILAALQQRFPDLPVVMFTDSGNEQVAADGFRGGLADYVLKGAGQYVRLAHAVRRALERAHAKQMEREWLLREQEARLFAEEANRVKDQFLATLSHELRTPLNAIAGWLHILRLHLDDPQQVRNCLDRAGRNVVLLGRIIDDLTDVSRIATGKLSFHPTRVELASVVQAAIHAVAEAASAKSIRVTFSESGPGIAVLGDGDRLQQVAANLLANAVKFTPRGGHVAAAVDADAQHAVLTVRDTGQGMKPEFVARAFDRFSQQDGGPARQHDGLGLGLALVRELVEMHGGRVAITSPGEHQGTTVVVTLPLSTEARQPAAGSPAPAAISGLGPSSPGSHDADSGD